MPVITPSTYTHAVLRVCFSACLLLSSGICSSQVPFVSLASNNVQSSNPLPKVLHVAIYHIAYNTLINGKGYDKCSDITSDDFELFDRTIVEIAILCRAITIQGMDTRIQFHSAPNYSRAVRMAETGKVHTLAESVWSKDVSNTTFATIDVLRVGEFEKGIYVNADHALLKEEFSLDVLDKYTAATYKAWNYDWALLSEMTDSIVPVVKRDSLFHMLAAKRADFTLWEFASNNDLSVQYSGVVIQPVKGVKVLMPDSRRFIFSKTFEGSDLFFRVIDIGLEKMRKKGEIRRYYEKGGFINSLTKDWKVINDTEGVLRRHGN